MTLAAAADIAHRGRLVQDEPLAKHCSWRTGGRAAYFFEPADTQDLLQVLPHFRDSAITWIGLGSNVLIRDGGLDGLVISTSKGLNTWRWLDQNTLFVGCGLACAKIAKESVNQGFAGAEFFAGIPGSIGGALAMNAGAFGGETWDLVRSAEVVNRNGEQMTILPGDYVTGYRHVGLPVDHWFLSAVLEFSGEQQECPATGQARIRELLSERSASQPTGVASCGSVFKNPPEDFAGRLIEQAGLKGFAFGKCRVSDKHANFILNEHDASADEIERLIKHIQRTVLEQHGVLLEPEVRIIGRSLDAEEQR